MYSPQNYKEADQAITKNPKLVAKFKAYLESLELNNN